MSEFLSSFVQQLAFIESAQLLTTCKMLAKTAALLNIDVSSIKALLNRGGLETYVALMILQEIGELKSFQELDQIIQAENMKKELVEILFKAFPEESIEKYVAKAHELKKETMQTVMSVVEEIGHGLDLEMREVIIERLENVKNVIRENRYSRGDLYEDYSDISVPHYTTLLPYHRTTSIMISTLPDEISHNYLEKVLNNINKIKGFSGEIIPYYSLLFKNENLLQITEIWETVAKDLLHLDGYIRKQASFILKKYMIVSQNHTSQWDTFWELYDNLDNYSRHLVEGLWPRVMPLFNWEHK